MVALVKASVLLKIRLGYEYSSITFPACPDDTAIEHFGEIRATLAGVGKPIGPYDLQIAAIVLAYGLILVMHNTREFARVPGLPGGLAGMRTCQQRLLDPALLPASGSPHKF